MWISTPAIYQKVKIIAYAGGLGQASLKSMEVHFKETFRILYGQEIAEPL